MRERPILFSGPMIRAILDDQKSVTRRVVALPRWATPGTLEGDGDGLAAICTSTGCLANITCPFGVAGDRLWVKETWLPHEHDDGADIAIYRADYADGKVPHAILDEREGRSRWKSGRFMPRVASRITLEVTEARAEPLHQIDDADARREGVGSGPWASPRDGFARLWEKINGARAPWESNPWVWRIAFKLIDVRGGRGRRG